MMGIKIIFSVSSSLLTNTGKVTAWKSKFDGNCLKQEKIPFTLGPAVNIYVASETNLCLFTVGQDFTLRNSLFGVVKLSRNADPIELDLMRVKFCCCLMVVGLVKTF